MNPTGNWAFDIATLIIPLTIAIVFHEVAHGGVARLFGDRTASDLGRLSLNPVRHVDPFGTIILPGALALAGAPVFGWAKPVPVVPARMRNPRWNMVAVAAAGPASNIVLALFATLLIGLLYRSMPDPQAGMGGAFIFANLVNFITINLFLALFNMIPLPPFDGSKVLAGFLPPALGERYQALDRYALPFMIILLMVIPWLFPEARLIERFVGPPFAWMSQQLDGLATAVAGRN